MWEQLILGTGIAVSIVIGLTVRDETRGNKALEHPTRRRIFDTLRRRPGRRLHELWKALKINRETVRYHVLILERAGVVDNTRADGSPRFFPAGMDDADAIAVLLRGHALDVVDEVTKNPGVTQGELVAILGIHRKTFRDYADRLLAHELIEEERRWREKRYYPTDRLERTLPIAQAAQKGTAHQTDDPPE